MQAGITGSSGQIKFDLGLGNSITTGPVDYEYSDPFAEELNNQRLADINGDGNLDVVGVSGQKAVVYAGDGAGGFTKIQSFAIETVTEGRIELADFNGDGNLDLLQVSRTNGTTSRPATGADAAVINFGNSNGTFAAGVTPNSNFIATAAEDFNGDGRDDISGLYWVSGINEWRQSTIYGNANGTFTNPTASLGFSEADDIFATVSANVNGIGVNELVNLYQDGSTAPFIFLDYVGGISTSSLQFINNFNAGFETNLLAADFNNDGNIDIVVSEINKSRLYLGNGNSTFQAGVVTTFDYVLGDSEAGDLNNDGNVDILRAGLTLFGNGNGTFSQSTSVTGGSKNFELGDINNDGALDIVSNVLRLSHINTLSNTRISYLNLTDTSAATSSSTFIASVASVIDLESGKIAAAQSRLSQAASFVDVMRENNAAASNKITSIDHAQEITKLTSIQVRLDSSTALLAQAGKLSLSVIDLLK